MPDRDYVIIVGASPLVFPAYRIAREDLGLGIIAFDWDPDAIGMRYADIPVIVSTKDIDAAITQARKLAAQYSIRGVFTCGADIEVTIAAIAEALELPGIPMEVALTCNDKIAMHQYLDKQDFTAKPRYHVVTTLHDAQEAVTNIGLPCFIKPIANCGSRGVQKLSNVKELPVAFELARKLNLGKDNRVLLEQALEGSKHTVEMIVANGKRYLLSIIDTHYISERWPCESLLHTTLLSELDQSRLFEFSSSVAESIGIDIGAHKVDVNLDSQGNISLIELTARLSGGFHCQYASPLAYGSNDIRAALRLAVGQTLELEDIKHQFNRGSAVKSLLPPPGRIRNITGLDEARGMAGVKEIFFWKGVGEDVGPYYNSTDRFAFVITSGETTMEAIAVANKAAECIKIETQPFKQ